MKQHPYWLKKRLDFNEGFLKTKAILKRFGVNTVCESSRCPNSVECFSKNFATFLILGTRCTRSCRYCSVRSGIPQPPDIEEPRKVSDSVVEMGLKYAVITSVTRDDLPDGGSSQFVKVVEAIRMKAPHIKIELLVPDFAGKLEEAQKTAQSRPEVFGHNLETVQRLFTYLRPKADYRRSLELLKSVKDKNSALITKSGIMLGLGEKEEEVVETMGDLREGGCDLLTLGQYLRPSADNVPVVEYVPPDEFKKYREMGMSMGFKHVSSGPFVRSSYFAEESYNELMEVSYGKCRVAAAC
ncbi:MAG: lipoyl synthase [Candidatus Omnitrophica bacterium]|nr:lipoyl synthase [Candidatus Omnitrophota bacterium]